MLFLEDINKIEMKGLELLSSFYDANA